MAQYNKAGHDNLANKFSINCSCHSNIVIFRPILLVAKQKAIVKVGMALKDF